MKRIMTKISKLVFLLNVAVFTCATPAIAQNNSFKGDIPLESKPQYGITLGAVFLQPTATNLDYAVHGFPFPAISPHWDVAAVNPDYTAGLNLGLHYISANGQNDIELTWVHVNTSDSDSTFGINGQFVTPLFQSGPSSGQSLNPPSEQAFATAKFNYDVVNLDAGQYVNYGQNTRLRYFAGLSGAQLKQTLSISFQDDEHTFNINSENNSRFTGIGPIFGIDALYRLPKNFGITGRVAASALIGSIHASTTYNSTSPELTLAGINNNYQDISPDNSTQVVPALDSKLGLNFNHSFGTSTTFTIEAGYQYATYFNALVAYNPNTVVSEINLGAIAVSSLGKSVSNLSMSGPFINVSFYYS